jgi:hypothetical protein
MPGLDPGIHPSSKSRFEMDCRVKPGNDENGNALSGVGRDDSD